MPIARELAIACLRFGLLAIFLCLFGLVVSTQASPLFQAVPTSKTALAATESPEKAAKRVRIVTLDNEAEWLAKPGEAKRGSKLDLNLFEGTTLAAVLETVTPCAEGRYV